MAEDATNMFNIYLDSFEANINVYKTNWLVYNSLDIKRFYLLKHNINGEYDVKRHWGDLGIDKDLDFMVSIEGVELSLDKIGNFFVGHNGREAGFLYNDISSMGVWVELAKIYYYKIIKGNPSYSAWNQLKDEQSDQRFYYAGYLYSKHKKKDETYNKGLLKLTLEWGKTEEKEDKLKNKIKEYDKAYKEKNSN